jgi:flagellar protein FliS
MTAEPGKLILICYRQAIINLEAAQENYLVGNYEAKAKNIQKAIDIIGELNSSLNFEKGGAVAKNLDSLYRFMMHHIVTADLKRNVQGLAEVANMLKDLETAWKEIADNKKVAPGAYVPQRMAMAAGGGLREGLRA